MGFFDLFKQSNINQGIEEYKMTAGAVLLDVRTLQEYQEGHIPECLDRRNRRRTGNTESMVWTLLH